MPVTRRHFWRADPARWFEDIGLPLDLFDHARDEACADPFCSGGTAEGRLCQIRVHANAARRSQRWWFWAIQCIGIGFATGVLLHGVLAALPDLTTTNRIWLWGMVGSGAAMGAAASVLNYDWLHPVLPRPWRTGLLLLSVMGLLVSFLIGSAEFIAIGSFVYLILLPGVMMGPVISESVARTKLRKEHANEFMLALTLGLLRATTARSTVHNDPMHQTRMLWGLEELAGALQDFRVTQPPVSDAALQRRREQTADYRAEAIRQWMEDVLEPEGVSHAVLAQKLRSVLVILLGQRWAALPQAIAIRERVRPREWVGGIFAVVTGLALFIVVTHVLSEVAGNPSVYGLLAPVKTIAPVIVPAWIWLWMPLTLKRGFQARIAGLKELRELR